MQIDHKKIKHTLTHNLVVKGTLILTITGFSTRIIGFYNRIFLSGLIGAKEMGIYQLIFPLYMVAFSLTTYGNEMALTKLVSEYKSRSDIVTARAFFRICFLFNLTLGIFTSTIMCQNAAWLCIHILNAPECISCLQILSLGVPFMAAKGAIHGYFLGLENSAIHGISDFLEQTAKIAGLYVLATLICVRQSYPASFAVWGIVIGEIVSLAYSVIALLFHRKKNPLLSAKTPHASVLLRIFIKTALPLTTNRLFLTILQSIEAIMIPTVLLLYYGDSEKSLSIYGIFTGMSFPFIMFPSTITNSLSTMLLPAVSSANSSLQTDYLKKLCRRSLFFCLLVGGISSITFFFFGKQIGMLFFQTKEAGIFLYQLSFLCPFIYLATTLASILNGLGHASYNLVLTILATFIRIGFIRFTIPQIGITGYILGLFTSYVFLTFVCSKKLHSLIRINTPIP